MTDKPLCPYCGDHNGHQDGVWMEVFYGYMGTMGNLRAFCCPECGSVSPPDSSYSKALAKAFGRFQPMQKPMTLEEVLSIDGIGLPCFVEFRNERGVTCIEPAILTNRYHYCGEQIIDCVKFLLTDINVTWRPWRTRPTNKERATAKWENGDLHE